MDGHLRNIKKALAGRIALEKNWVEVAFELAEACSSRGRVDLQQSTKGRVNELLVESAEGAKGTIPFEWETI